MAGGFYMLNIIYDPNKLYQDYSDIIVDDTASYIRSQILIQELKENKRDSLYIVIIRPSYINYYDVFEDIPSWSNINEYNLDTILGELELGFTESEKKKIGTLISDTKDRVVFLKDYNKDLSLDENLLKYIFHNGEDIPSIECS